MESQPQNPEFRNKPENIHPWRRFIIAPKTNIKTEGSENILNFCSKILFISSMTQSRTLVKSA